MWFKIFTPRVTFAELLRRGRVIQLFGKKYSGKSLYLLSIAKFALDDGLKVFLIDNSSKIRTTLLDKMTLDREKAKNLVLFFPSSLSSFVEAIDDLDILYRGKYALILVDNFFWFYDANYPTKLKSYKYCLDRLRNLVSHTKEKPLSVVITNYGVLSSGSDPQSKKCLFPFLYSQTYRYLDDSFIVLDRQRIQFWSP